MLAPIANVSSTQPLLFRRPPPVPHAPSFTGNYSFGMGEAMLVGISLQSLGTRPDARSHLAKLLQCASASIFPLRCEYLLFYSPVEAA